MSVKLELNGISKNFGGVTAIADFSLKAEDGQIVGVIGPNGAGKTTIFNVISGIYPTDSGSMIFDGVDITNMQQHEIALLGLSRTFQNIRLFKGLTCMENVKAAIDTVTHYNLFQMALRLPARAREEARIDEICRRELEWVGMGDYLDARPENLAYGYQRRLEIARALASNPKILLLDEPAAGLNPKEVLELTDLIFRIRNERHITILLIEHHLDMVMTLCDNIYVQNFGKTIFVGTPTQVQNDPQVIRAYLGEGD